MASDKVRGPAAYFPSIEAKYGRSIAEWKAEMERTALTTWKELMAWLKENHSFRHGPQMPWSSTSSMSARGAPSTS